VINIIRFLLGGFGEVGGGKSLKQFDPRRPESPQKPDLASHSPHRATSWRSPNNCRDCRKTTGAAFRFDSSLTHGSLLYKTSFRPASSRPLTHHCHSLSATTEASYNLSQCLPTSPLLAWRPSFLRSCLHSLAQWPRPLSQTAQRPTTQTSLTSPIRR